MARAVIDLKCMVSDTIARAVGGGSDPVVSEILKQLDLGASTTPDITQVYAAVLTLSSGALTVALDTVTTMNGTANGLNGLVVQGFCLVNMGANTMTFTSSVTNGYAIFSATNGTVVEPGGFALNHSATGFGTISGSASDFDIAGTGSQTCNFLCWAGAA